MSKKDKYNRKVMFGLFFTSGIIGTYFTFNQIILHKHFFLTLIVYLITMYCLVAYFKFIKLFIHGVPANDFDIVLSECLNQSIKSNEDEGNIIFSKDLDRIIFVELKQLIKNKELYYIYDYAFIIKNICENYYSNIKSENQFTITLILNKLKTINKIVKDTQKNLKQ